MEFTRTLTPRQFIGKAVVMAVRYDDQATTLKLRTFAGVHLRYTIGCVPDPAGAAQFCGTSSRPIAVKIQQGGEPCTVTALTGKGAWTSRCPWEQLWHCISWGPRNCCRGSADWHDMFRHTNRSRLVRSSAGFLVILQNYGAQN